MRRKTVFKVLAGITALFIIGAIVSSILASRADSAIDRAHAKLEKCEDGMDDAEHAASLLRLRALNPFAAHGVREARDSLGGLVMNGIAVCDEQGVLAASVIERAASLVGELVTLVGPTNSHFGLRYELEDTLHEAGYDALIVKLQDTLPRGGDVRARVRAHINLGDLEGALRTWAEPGATRDDVNRASSFPDDLTRGALLCFHKDYAAAAPELDATLAAYRKLGDPYQLDTFLPLYARCAFAAGHAERVTAAIEGLGIETKSSNVMVNALHDTVALLRFEVVAAGSDITATTKAYDSIAATAANTLTPIDVQATAMLAEIAAGDLAGALTLFGTTRLSFMAHGLETPIGEEMFNPIFFPAFDRSRMRELADAFAAAPTGAEAGAAIYEVLAIDAGACADPAAEAELQRAEHLTPGAAAIANVRTALAFAQQRFSSAAEYLAASKAQLRPKPGADDDISGILFTGIGEGAYANPGEDRYRRLVRALVDSKLPPEKAWALLSKQSGLDLQPKALCLRLLTMRGLAKVFGADPKPADDQLAAIRAMLAVTGTEAFDRI